MLYSKFKNQAPKVMTVLRGRYINLKGSQERRSQIQKQLIKLEKQSYYERFEAIKGDAEEASQRNLNAGELGLWKSWIKLLSEESEKSVECNFLHIIEDDCILTKEFFQACNNLSIISKKYDLIATDMYVNPSIYRYLTKTTEIDPNNKQVTIQSNLYTGCTSSVLVPKDGIEKLRNLFTIEYSKNKTLVPIDNFLIRLQEQKRIKTGITLPFLTSILPESIGTSTIQCREEEAIISKTQKICYLLRKKLSVTCKNTYSGDMIRAATELINLNTNSQKKERDIVTEMTISYLEQKKYCNYKYRENLEGEPLNSQRKPK